MSHNNKRSKKRAPGKKRRPAGASGRREFAYEDFTMMKTPVNIIPDETFTTLKWPTSFVLTSVGAQRTSKRWVPNGAYDLDPILATTSMPGFVEWSAFYNFYRVVAYTYRLEVVNAQSFPLTAFVLNTNNDLGTGGTNFEAYSTAPYNTFSILPAAPTAASKKVFRGRFEVARILGSKAPETEDNYRATVVSNPADLIWLSLGIDTFSATNLLTAAGVYCHLTLETHMRFYGRKDLTN